MCMYHVSAMLLLSFLCMYVGCICILTNKYQRGNYYVCMYVVLGTSGGESGFGTFLCFLNKLFLYMFIILQYSMYVCALYVCSNSAEYDTALCPVAAVDHHGMLICIQKYRECSRICSLLQTYLFAYMMLLQYMYNFKMIFLLTLTLRFCSRQRQLLLLQWLLLSLGRRTPRSVKSCL
jgi:hypothetical protein